jgi:hypothetical protein
MTFILTFTLPPETRDEAIARFLETGGQPPPAVTLLGRWTQLDLCGGFVLLESADPQALAAFAHGWSDVLALTLAPVLKDQDLAEVLKRASAQPTPKEEALSTSPHPSVQPQYGVAYSSYECHSSSAACALLMPADRFMERRCRLPRQPLPINTTACLLRSSVTASGCTSAAGSATARSRSCGLPVASS